MIQTLFRLRRGPSSPPTVRRLSASLNSTESASIQWSVQRDTEGQQHRVSAGPTARLPGRSDRPSMVTTRPSVQPRQVVDWMASQPSAITVSTAMTQPNSALGISSQVRPIYHAAYTLFDSSGRPVTAQIPSASAGQQSTQFSLGRGDRTRLSTVPDSPRVPNSMARRSAVGPTSMPQWGGPPIARSRSSRQPAACPAMHTP